MRLTLFEKDIISRFLVSMGIEPSSNLVLDEVHVEKRDTTEMGCYTELRVPNGLICESLPPNYRGGRVAARLNKGAINAGFVVYLSGHFISAIEGYDTMNEQWPTRIDNYEIYLLDYDSKGN